MKILQFSTKLARYIGLTCAYCLCSLIPKNKNKWVFGSWLGKKYSDNPRFFFEFVCKNHKEITAIWITKEKQLVRVVRKMGFRCEYAYSLKGILNAINAGVLVYSHSKGDDLYPFLSSRRAVSVQLWHGIPLKKIGFDDEKHEKTRILKKTFRSLLFPFSDDSRQHIFASSEEDANHFSSAFSSQFVHITGNARNDQIGKDNKNSSRYSIAFMPTFRDSIAHNSDILEYLSFDTQRWKEFLAETKSTLYIKLHPINTIDSEVFSTKYADTNIQLVDYDETNVFLAGIDLLVTDYSSVYFDFLLTERPVLFAPFDMQNYLVNDRSFYYSYNEITPGPVCLDWNDVRRWIKKFMKDKTLYCIERDSMRSKFHRYNDGNNSYRIFQAIIKIISGKTVEFGD